MKVASHCREFSAVRLHDSDVHELEPIEWFGFIIFHDNTIIIADRFIFF